MWAETASELPGRSLAKRSRPLLALERPATGLHRTRQPKRRELNRGRASDVSLSKVQRNGSAQDVIPTAIATIYRAVETPRWGVSAFLPNLA